MRILEKDRTDTCGHTMPKEKENFVIVSTDESLIFYDSLVRKLWIDENKRPFVEITGSRKHSYLFGAIDMEGKQKFR